MKNHYKLSNRYKLNNNVLMGPYIMATTVYEDLNGLNYIRRLRIAMLRDERKEKLEKLGWR